MFSNAINIIKNSEDLPEIPSYIKMNKDVDNPRFIADGMNEFERNVKRGGDFLLSELAS